MLAVRTHALAARHRWTAAPQRRSSSCLARRDKRLPLTVARSSAVGEAAGGAARAMLPVTAAIGRVTDGACNPTAADGYVADLLNAEKTGDWTKTIELLTEVRVLKLELPHDTVEAGIRTLVNGAPRWQLRAGCWAQLGRCRLALEPPGARLHAAPCRSPAQASSTSVPWT
jgi:hypothetical protein